MKNALETVKKRHASEDKFKSFRLFRRNKRPGNRQKTVLPLIQFQENGENQFSFLGGCQGQKNGEEQMSMFQYFQNQEDGKFQGWFISVYNHQERSKNQCGMLSFMNVQEDGNKQLAFITLFANIQKDGNIQSCVISPINLKVNNKTRGDYQSGFSLWAYARHCGSQSGSIIGIGNDVTAQRNLINIVDGDNTWQSGLINYSKNKGWRFFTPFFSTFRERYEKAKDNVENYSSGEVDTIRKYYKPGKRPSVANLEYRIIMKNDERALAAYQKMSAEAVSDAAPEGAVIQ